MAYKLMGKNSRDALSAYRAYSLAAETARKVEEVFFGTPKHEVGHVANDLEEMQGKRKGIVGQLADYVTLPEQYRYQWGFLW